MEKAQDATRTFSLGIVEAALRPMAPMSEANSKFYGQRRPAANSSAVPLCFGSPLPPLGASSAFTTASLPDVVPCGPHHMALRLITTAHYLWR